MNITVILCQGMNDATLESISSMSPSWKAMGMGFLGTFQHVKAIKDVLMTV